MSCFVFLKNKLNLDYIVELYAVCLGFFLKNKLNTYIMGAQHLWSDAVLVKRLAW